MTPGRSVVLALLLHLVPACAPVGTDEESPPASREERAAASPVVQALEAELEREVERLEGPGNFVRHDGWVPPNSIIPPCPPGSAAYEEASRELSLLDDAIASADRWDDVEPLTERLGKFLAHDCVATSRRLQADFYSVSTLRQFWTEGGHDALRAALDVDVERTLVIPAGVRDSVDALESEYPELRLSCDAGTDCAAEAAFRSDFAEELRISSLEAALGRLNENPDWVPSRARCARATASAPEENRFDAWQECIGQPVVEGPLLPVGNLKVPAEGWLFVAHSNPFGAGAYTAVDLATGATLARSRHSPCFQDGTGEEACESTTALPRSAANASSARHLLWLLLIERITSFGAPKALTVSIPDAIEPLVGPLNIEFVCGGSCGLTDRHSWAYVSPAGVTLAAGERSDCGHRRESSALFGERVDADQSAIVSAAAGGNTGDLLQLPPRIDPRHLREGWDLASDDELVEWSNGSP